MKPVRVKVQGLEAAGALRGVVAHFKTAADPCVYCGGPASTREHILPKSAGGKNHWTNMARACAVCNHNRSSTPLLHWLLQRRAA